MSVLQWVLREATVTFCISCWSWIAALRTLRQLVFTHARDKLYWKKYKKSQKFKTKCNYFMVIEEEKVLKCLYSMSYELGQIIINLLDTNMNHKVSTFSKFTQIMG